MKSCESERERERRTVQSHHSGREEEGGHCYNTLNIQCPLYSKLNIERESEIYIIHTGV